MKPVLFDFYCKAGGASYGYHLAGFEVIGVDIEPQPNYPFEFIKMDAIEAIYKYADEFDAAAASPPCQLYSATSALSNGNHPDLVGETRVALKNAGKPYIIENVVGAPLDNPLMLCGTMFGLDVIRHRLFECWPEIWFPPAMCNHYKPVVKCGRPVDLDKQFHSVVGHFSGVEAARQAMGIDWMTQEELAQAIPPAYTEYLGKQLMKHVKAKSVALGGVA